MKLLESGTVIKYNGELSPDNDELKFFKEVLSISDDVIFKQEFLNIFMTDNIVIKSLMDKYEDISSNSTFSCDTIQLTIRAYNEGVGAKYLTHIDVNDSKNKLIRCYLFTEYIPQIQNTFDKKAIRNFAIKISKTTLKFHPDFWYTNICINEDEELKAIDWDYYMYNEAILCATTEEEYIENMMAQYMRKYYHKHRKKIPY